MEQVMNRLVVYLAIAAAGALLKKVGLLKEADKQILINIMVCFTLPCAIVFGFRDTSPENIFWVFVLFALAYHVVQLTIAILRTLHASGEEKAQSVIHSTAQNIGNFAMPMMQSMLAPAAFVYGGIFDTICTMFTLGINYAIAAHFAQKSSKGILRSIGKKLIQSLPLWTYVAVLLVLLLRIELPEVIFNITGTVAKSNVVLAMILAGMVVDLRIKKEWMRSIVVTLSIRYGVALAFSAVAFFAYQNQPLLFKTLTMCFLAPYSNGILFFSNECRCDPKISGALLSFSIVITIALYTMLQLLFAYGFST